MTSFENLTSAELMILAKLRKVDGCENISRQQLRTIFPTPPTPEAFRRFALRPKKFTPKKPTPAFRPKKSTPKKWLQTKTDCRRF